MDKIALDPDEDDLAWTKASRRANVIRRLLESGNGHLTPSAVASAILELISVDLACFASLPDIGRLAATSAFLPMWRGRLNDTRSLAEEIKTFWLRPEKPRFSCLVDRIVARCYEVGIRRPNWRRLPSFTR
jgi:hypothetical protein